MTLPVNVDHRFRMIKCPNCGAPGPHIINIPDGTIECNRCWADFKPEVVAA